MSSLINNFQHAFRGIRYAAKESIFRVHCVIGCLVLLFGYLLNISRIEFVILIVMIGWVLTLEIINTIIEHLVDLLKPEFHVHAKIVKDLASGAVLVFSSAAAVIGCVVFIPRVIQIFYRLAEQLVS